MSSPFQSEPLAGIRDAARILIERARRDEVRLEALVADAETAANGLEALLAAYEMRPAVIVMDVTMPMLDGLEATRLIKAAAATRHARVIAYTGNPTLSDSLAERLFVAVLQKPAAPDVVVAMVQHVASR
jgi:CheY-like chemotaxis protein